MHQLKACQNLHMNIAIAYRENVAIAYKENVAIAYRDNVAIAYRKNGVLNNVNSLLFAMTHYNRLETEMHQLKARHNLHMNVILTYRENVAIAFRDNVTIAYRENVVIAYKKNVAIAY